MKVIQLLPTLSFGDAVSNDTLALGRAISRMGYNTDIYAESVDIRLPKGSGKLINKMPAIEDDDVILYHLSTGTKLNYKLAEYNCKKIIRYHNITPPHFMEEYNVAGAQLCLSGLEGASFLRDKADYCLADSDFNKQDLIDMGYKCDIDVLPILIQFEDYKGKPNEDTVRRLSDGCTNILFTGRIAPNKKQEDVIRAFYYYKKYYNPKSRLILCGSHNGMERYYHRLKSYVNALDLQDVMFAGHVKFNDILAFYRTADVFLCQSEHEGFCVPLVEAMFFDVPVVAYNSTAIPSTLGGSGILLDKKNAVETAAVIDRVVKDKDLRGKVIANQRERLKSFDNAVIEEKFVELFKRRI